MKYYYTSYVQHMIRMYMRIKDMPCDQIKTAIDLQNLDAVKAVVNDVGEEVSKIVFELTAERDTRLCDAISAYASTHEVSENALWKYVHDFEFKCAKRRGLI